jgi:methylated-DNA-protein-cysteine methyltransferase-like protein
MSESTTRFSEDVYALVAQIPAGKVMSYGQIAALCGHPGAARVVGQIAHFGPSDLPWQRVVNANGGMARGFWPGGPEGQAKMLVNEGIKINHLKLRIEEYRWWPTR